MATNFKTPGVYIREPDSFPPSIVGVDTAVPCFIGYTEFAIDSDKRDLHMTAKRIDSMAEFVQFFGRGYSQQYYLATPPAAGAKAEPATDLDWGLVSLDGSNSYALRQVGSTVFDLYNSLRLFYSNGGGPCYIISCGLFETGDNPTETSADDFLDAIAVSQSFVGPTMIAIPDALQLSDKDQFNKVTAAMLNSCAKTGDRMALLDVYGATTLSPRDDWQEVIDDFRDGIRSQVPSTAWRFGAAYFPPLVTSVVSPSEIDISNFADDGNPVLQTALLQVLSATYPAPAPSAATPATPTPPPPGGETVQTGGSETPPATPATPDAGAALNAKGQTIYRDYVQNIGKSVATLALPTAANPVPAGITHKQLTGALVATVPGFQNLLTAIAATQGVLPTSGAIAGVWATNDATRGVWNAPANVGIATMVMPKLPIAGDEQDDLNVPVQGLAVNAIRTFQGRGSLIWGARTLDSLSNDWRYIQVRRTMIYVEQSVKQALDAMVFRPNTAQTWVTVTSMIESFLHGLWAAGGLMGNSPAEAYNVVTGLGSTMTPDDVLNGVMRVQVTLQMVHPAEFIELTFKQQMLGGA
jgi:uncharacterized protein